MISRSALMALAAAGAVCCATACTPSSGGGLAPAAPAPAIRVVRALPATSTPVVALDAASSGPAVSADVYGANEATWFDYTQSFVNPALRGAGIHLVRFPGGSESDAYHWENGGSVCASQGYITPNSTFDAFMQKVAAPLGLDVSITLNYGSNRACSGGGDPTEAAAWVAYAKSKGYNVPYWTVGNENYGSWEYDLHASPHDPATYAAAVKTGYYPDVKHANPNAKLGVVVNTPDDAAWNTVVLSKSGPFDFVELHYYPQYITDNDATLLGQDVTAFASDLTGLRSQMTAAGVAASTPIYLGEYNADAGTEGKQSVSIVNGLFLGQILGTLLDAGVPRATWWLANGSCDAKGTGGDFSPSLYGWQNFGSEALFSDGLPDPYEGCSATPAIRAGASFPTARVMAAMSFGVPGGSSVRKVTISPASLSPSVRAYGFARAGGGYVLALFNNTLQSVAVDAAVKNAPKASYAGTLLVYGADQYDYSKKNRWVGPATAKLGTVGAASIPLTLPRYSLTLLTLR